MVTSSILKHLLTDDESLQQYVEGGSVSLQDLKRRMLLQERSENRAIPDHHYRLVIEERFKNLNSLSDVFTTGLYHIADYYLELRGKKIHVKQEKQNQWQELITYIPPLVLQAAFLFHKAPLLDTSEVGIQKYFYKYILPNTRYTALPTPYVPQLQGFIDVHEGFYDLHVHLNGATETDHVWQDYLSFPDKIYEDLQKAFKHEKVREQLEQESSFLRPINFLDLLKKARKIREMLNYMLYPESLYPSVPPRLEQAILKLVTGGFEEFSGSYKHPFSSLITNREHPSRLMPVECLMYILVLDFMKFNPDSFVSSLFHFYLLILGQANRLLVQQTHQHGFEQFQKHTLNGLRDTSEKEYRNRFFQMHGNDLNQIKYIEGRFSPKLTARETAVLIAAIEKGWNALRRHLTDEKDISETDLPQLKLIAHFIKRPDKGKDYYVRHKELRIDNWVRAKSIVTLIEKSPFYGRNIIGVDAAASEFDAPPEVFAPVFRMLRRKGFQHFTYHAGEDFHHIISGLRAIYEAIHFNRLSNGDRIGHATATGLSTKQWLAIIGKEQLIHRGEWLDNLVFVYHLIISEEIIVLRGHMPHIINQIQEHAASIYDKSYSNKVLSDAWLLRQFCPILFSADIETGRSKLVYDNDEWTEAQNEKKRLSPETIEAFCRYHEKPVRDKYQGIITIDPSDLFNAEELEILQLAVLKFMHRKEIVIETLPTSNIRIGHHPDYSTYHLWNWIYWEKAGHSVPPVIVGTDDTGIFATSIFNEFANIYCHLIGCGKMTHSQALEYIKKLNENSKIYRFKNAV